MKNVNAINKALLVGVLLTPSLLLAAVPNSFTTGDPIVASEMNDNFNDLDGRVTSNEARISIIESATPSSVDFSNYFPAFSALGSPRNAQVLAQPTSSGGTLYRVRGGYENSSDQININGVPTLRDNIWYQVFVNVDSIGDITSINRYRESPDDLNDYLNANSYTVKVDNTNYNPVTLAPTIDPNDYTETFTCGDDGVPAILVCHAIDRLNSDNSFFDQYDWARIQSVVTGPYTIPNGMTFTDVRFESYTSSNRMRIRAKGIGMIYENSDGDFALEQIIYYRVNGQTGGSLVGTPFEPGVGALDGLFF